MRTTRAAIALVLLLAASPAAAEGASASFAVSLRVLPRVQSGLPGNARAALVTLAGTEVSLPCGAEGSAACDAAVARAGADGATVVVTVLPDGSPTSIVER